LGHTIIHVRTLMNEWAIPVYTLGHSLMNGCAIPLYTVGH